MLTPTQIGIIVVVVAVAITWRLKPSGIWDALEKIVGFGLGTFVVVRLLVWGLPLLVSNAGGDSGALMGLWSDGVAPAFSAGETTTTVSNNTPYTINPNAANLTPPTVECIANCPDDSRRTSADGGGGLPAQTAASNPPAPQPQLQENNYYTDTLRIQTYNTLGEAWLKGDINTGLTAANSLLAIIPNDTKALQALNDIEVAKSQIGTRRQNLATLTADGQIGLGVLEGRFRVIEDGNQAFTRTSKEVSIIEDLNEGWTYGDRFNLPRSILLRMSIELSDGTVFTVANGFVTIEEQTR